MSVANNTISRIGLFLANPMVAKLDKVEEHDDTKTTLRGITWKTLFLLVLTIVGVWIFFATSSMIPNTYVETVDDVQVNMIEAVIAIGGLCLAMFFTVITFKFVRSAMVLGSLYSIIQGYALAFLFHLVGVQYVYPAIYALILTIIVVFVMLLLYRLKLVRINHKFVSCIITTIFMGIILGIIYIVLSMIPECKEFITYLQNNQMIFLIASLLGVVISSLFLIVDFEVLSHCVKDELPKKYEWLAAFALSFSVIELYLKIFNFLIRVMGKNTAST